MAPIISIGFTNTGKMLINTAIALKPIAPLVKKSINTQPNNSAPIHISTSFIIPIINDLLS
jgi:hypothetical protein